MKDGTLRISHVEDEERHHPERIVPTREFHNLAWTEVAEIVVLQLADVVRLLSVQDA